MNPPSRCTQTVATWLSELGKSKYAGKFVDNFSSLSELAMAASDPDVGIAAVLQECDVKGVRGLESTHTLVL